jgi:hypothetical protein
VTPSLTSDDGRDDATDIASMPAGSDRDMLISPKTPRRPIVSFEGQNARKRVPAKGEIDDSSADSSPISASHPRVKGLSDKGPYHMPRHARRGSTGSNVSFEGKGSRGISLGVAKPVSGIVNSVEPVGNIVGSSDEGGNNW